MDTFKTYNIYPMTTDNLQALLDYYFYGYKKTPLGLFVKDFFDTNITLKELELVAEKISRHIPLLEKELGKPISQINILQFGIEAIKGSNWDNNDRTKERRRIIEAVQKALTYRKLVWHENDINLDGKFIENEVVDAVGKNQTDEFFLTEEQVEEEERQERNRQADRADYLSSDEYLEGKRLRREQDEDTFYGLTDGQNGPYKG